MKRSLFVLIFVSTSIQATEGPLPKHYISEATPYQISHRVSEKMMISTDTMKQVWVTEKTKSGTIKIRRFTK